MFATENVEFLMTLYIILCIGIYIKYTRRRRIIGGAAVNVR